MPGGYEPWGWFRRHWKEGGLPPEYYRQKRRNKLQYMLERERWTFWVMQSFKPQYQPGSPRIMLSWYMSCVKRWTPWPLESVFMATHRHARGSVHLHGFWRVRSGAVPDWRIVKEYCWRTFGKAGIYVFREGTGAVSYALRYAMNGGKGHVWAWETYQ